MFCYGVATVSRIDEIIGLFCRISSLLSGSFAKETYNFIDPTNRSHPIGGGVKGERARESTRESARETERMREEDRERERMRERERERKRENERESTRERARESPRVHALPCQCVLQSVVAVCVAVR